MKQIIITITMLAIALALVIGVVVPIFKHGASTGDKAILKGQAIEPRIVQLLE